MADISSMGSTSAVILLSSPARSMRSRNSRKSGGPIPRNCCVSILVTTVSAPIAWTDISPSFMAPETSARGKRSEEHTSELQSHSDLVCRLLLEKKKIQKNKIDELRTLL